jgi:hypothetical protein
MGHLFRSAFVRGAINHTAGTPWEQETPMTVQMVRFTTTEDHVADVEAGIDAMIAAIGRAQPPGRRYAACKERDGVTFILLLELADGVENPLPAIPEARAFQQQMPTWAATPPAPAPLAVVGS